MTDLLVNDQGDWLDLTIDRPERRNALTPDLLFELADVVKSASDKTLIVLRGSGDRAFSSGFDLGVLRELGPAAHNGDPLGTATTALISTAVPTIAVLQGYCWGAAVELVAACDLRLGTASTSIAVPAGKMGAVYRPSGIDIVAKRFGRQAAVDLFVFGMAFDATDALGRGLISAILEEDDIQSFVDRITASPRLAAEHKQFLREWQDGAADLIPRWQAVRDAAVATRTIPTTTGGGA